MKRSGCVVPGPILPWAAALRAKQAQQAEPRSKAVAAAHERLGYTVCSKRSSHSPHQADVIVKARGDEDARQRVGAAGEGDRFGSERRWRRRGPCMAARRHLLSAPGGWPRKTWEFTRIHKKRIMALPCASTLSDHNNSLLGGQ